MCSTDLHFTGLTEIPAECFKNCIALTGLKIPKNVTSLGMESFSNCKALETLVIPSVVNSIGDGCFRDCTILNEISIPQTIDKLSDVLFFNCKGLKNITIPEGVTELGINCFGNCTTLSVVTLPSSITYIDEHCFSGCVSLGNIRSNPNTAPDVRNSTFGLDSTNYTGKNNDSNILLVPNESTGYDGTYWLDPLSNPTKGKFIKKGAYNATEATSLTITANDVSADDTTTIINWIAYTKGTNELTEIGRAHV